LTEDERNFNDNSLKPWECECGEWVSGLQKYCPDCGEEADEELRKHNSGNENDAIHDEKEKLEEAIHEYMEDSGMMEEIKQKI
jgi:predicted amidophosphoribosyltransferase